MVFVQKFDALYLRLYNAQYVFRYSELGQKEVRMSTVWIWQKTWINEGQVSHQAYEQICLLFTILWHFLSFITVNCDLLSFVIAWKSNKFLKNCPKLHYEWQKAIPITWAKLVQNKHPHKYNSFLIRLTNFKVFISHVTLVIFFIPDIFFIGSYEHMWVVFWICDPPKRVLP